MELLTEILFFATLFISIVATISVLFKLKKKTKFFKRAEGFLIDASKYGLILLLVLINIHRENIILAIVFGIVGVGFSVYQKIKSKIQ